ncbi:MAG: Nif3-like dinuclear metal center hexameric protein [Crocinitomicaceae bacterium]|tara:strand:- start:4012 stop:5106 length:1095 start_codon:yes stop_codon:yes gene_type:complete
MMIENLTDFLEDRFPLSLQESYDNCGLIYGHKKEKIKGVLIALDVTEEIVNEAIKKNCNLIVSHHPVIFRGLKKINGHSMTERVLEKCIQNKIALYAIHTNLDNHKLGVNKEIADRIGLKQVEILAPKKSTLVKLAIYVPTDAIKELDQAIFDAGAGNIGNYSECSFQSKGKGSFKPNADAKPHTGSAHHKTNAEEIKAEYILPIARLSKVLQVMNANHPYEEVAHDIIPILNEQQDVGSGMIGELETPMKPDAFLNKLKEVFGLHVVKHTTLIKNEIKTVVVCGGTGSFLIEAAKRKNADIFISSDIKYHEFFDADQQLIIADIGHYESEQYTIDLIYENLKEKFSNFALHLTEVNTNPVKYF